MPRGVSSGHDCSAKRWQPQSPDCFRHPKAQHRKPDRFVQAHFRREAKLMASVERHAHLQQSLATRAKLKKDRLEAESKQLLKTFMGMAKR